jgi:hypothetical protein
MHPTRYGETNVWLDGPVYEFDSAPARLSPGPFAQKITAANMRDFLEQLEQLATDHQINKQRTKAADYASRTVPRWSRKSAPDFASWGLLDDTASRASREARGGSLSRWDETVFRSEKRVLKALGDAQEAGELGATPRDNADVERAWRNHVTATSTLFRSVNRTYAAAPPRGFI